MTDDFFRNRLDQMIDLRHPLAVLGNRLRWQEIEVSLAHRWARQVKAGKKIEDLDLFGPTVAVVGGGVSNAGRPRLPTRLMVRSRRHTASSSSRPTPRKAGNFGSRPAAMPMPACSKRMRKVIKRQRTIVGRLQREVGCKMSTMSLAVQETLDRTLDKAKRLITQTGSRKALGNRAKLYSWHAPEAECISKGKSRNPYEFGVKVGLAMTLKGNLIVGGRSLSGNPYDGHTLAE